MAANRLKGLVTREKRRWDWERTAGAMDKTLWPLVREAMGVGGSGGGATCPLKKDNGTFAVSTTEKIAVLLPMLMPEMEDEGPTDDEEGSVRSQVRSPILCPPRLHIEKTRNAVAASNCQTPVGATTPATTTSASTSVDDDNDEEKGEEEEGRTNEDEPTSKSKIERKID